jgi:hypothetical protein
VRQSDDARADHGEVETAAQRVRQAWLRPIARASPAWTRRTAPRTVPGVAMGIMARCAPRQDLPILG